MVPSKNIMDTSYINNLIPITSHIHAIKGRVANDTLYGLEELYTTKARIFSSVDALITAVIIAPDLVIDAENNADVDDIIYRNHAKYLKALDAYGNFFGANIVGKGGDRYVSFP